MSKMKTPGWIGALAVVGLGAVTLTVGRGGHVRHPSAAGAPARTRAVTAAMPLAFEPNQGQADRSASFLTRGDGYGVFLRGNEAVIALARKRGTSAGAHGSHQEARGNWSLLRMKLVGANPHPAVAGGDELPGRTNYIIGNDPSKWRTAVPHFGKVSYNSVYPGVDLVYHGNGANLEYDFVVSPGSDPQQVRLRYEGAEHVAIRDGALVLRTSEGEVLQKSPVVYQDIAGQRRLVAGQYVALADNEIGFRLGAYDRQHTLVIDPVLNYGTYLGGTSQDAAAGLVLDADGNAYVTGYTYSTNFGGGQTLGTHVPNSAVTDAFVTKYSTDGITVLFTTYLGGSADENFDTGTSRQFGGVALDGARNIYLSGFTRSTDFPMVQPVQVKNAGNGDAFVAKLSPDGRSLFWSTYLGGAAEDAASGIAVDANNNTYVAGETASADFNIVNSYQNTNRGGGHDAFVTRINASGTGFVYSTYLGGTDDDRALGLAVDGIGNVYVTGRTLSGDFPVSASPFQPASQGSSDAFVTKFNPVASQIVYSSYLGGSGENTGTGIAVDTSGNAYVSGFTTSVDFPVTAGVYQHDWNSGISDGFLVKVNPTGTQEVYATYIGGNGEDVATSVAISPTGGNQTLAFVTGYTSSNNLPVVDALRTSPFGAVDAFVIKFNLDASAAEYCTYLGGSGDDFATGIRVDSNGAAYIAGTTSSHDLPVVRGANTTGPIGGASTDVFLTRLISPPAGPTQLSATVASNTEIDLAWTDTSDNELGFDVERHTPGQAFAPIAVNLTTNTYQDTGLTANTQYTYRVFAHNSVGASPYSNAVTKTTLPDKPADPSSLTVSPTTSPTALDLNWTDNASTSADLYVIERSDDQGLTFSVIATPAAPLSSYQDTGLTPATTYYYQVKARNLGGDSGYAGPASGTTIHLPPPAPAGQTAEAISGPAVLLKWTDNSTLPANEEAGFEIGRSPDGNPATYTVIQTVGQNTVSYVDSTVQPQTTYYYRIRAFNDGGNSAYAVTAPVFTLPAPPADPTNLVVTPNSQTSLTLTWDHSGGGEDKFDIERSSDNGATFTEIGSVPAGVHTYTDTQGLMAATSYSYRVRAENAGGFSGYAGPTDGTTWPNPPAAPLNLRATSVSQTQVGLAWTLQGTNEDGIRVFRALTSDGTFTEIKVLANGVQAYTDDTGLNPNTSYSYRVLAYNKGGPSAYSNTLVVSTLPTPPVAPVNLTVTQVAVDTMQLTWTEPSSNEDGFSIETSTDGVNFDALPPATVSSGTSTYFASSLLRDTQYYFRVRAFNLGGNSSYSNVVAALTSPAAPSGLAPSALTNHAVTVFWVNNSSTATRFFVYRGLTGQGGGFAKVGTVNAPLNSFRDTTLAASTGYTYYVTATNGGIESEASNQVSVTSNPDAPASPDGVAVASLPNFALEISWTDRSTTEDSFIIQRSLDGINFVPLATPVLPIDKPGVGQRLSAVDSNLAPGTTYYYNVVAHSNLGGDSAPSGASSGTTFANPPALPTGIVVKVQSSTSILVSWRDTANNENGFHVDRSDNGGDSFISLPDVAASPGTGVTVSFTDSGLNPNTSYIYQVRSFNGGGTSGFLRSAAALTLPAAPTAVTASALGNGSIVLGWTPDASGADGFKVERKSTGGFAQIATTGPGDASFSDPNVTANTTYVYQIRAFNKSGNSAYAVSSPISALAVLSSFTLNPPTIKGGKKTAGTITLTGLAPAGGAVITLNSTNKFGQVATSVTVPEGATRIQFPIRTLAVKVKRKVDITVTYLGIARIATLTVKP